MWMIHINLESRYLSSLASGGEKIRKNVANLFLNINQLQID